MPRRWIETLLAVLAVAALGLVLYNATLVDRRPPTVSRISLSATADGDEHVAQTLTAIDLAFSEPVDRASVEQRFRIEPYVGGTFSLGSRHDGDLHPGPEAPVSDGIPGDRGRRVRLTRPATRPPTRPDRSSSRPSAPPSSCR